MAFDASAKGRVWAFPKQRVTRDMLTARAVNSGRKVLGILPTGWAATGAAGLPSTPAGEDAAGGVSADDDDDEPAVIRAVPYSLHAPYEELRAIVRALAPVAVVGNTKPPRSPDAPAIDPEAFFSRLLSDPRTSEDEEDGDEEEDGDDAGFLDGKENDGNGHGIVRVFDAGAKSKKASPARKEETPGGRACRRGGDGAARPCRRPGRKPARSRSPPVLPSDPSPSGNDDDDDDDEGARMRMRGEPLGEHRPSGDSTGCWTRRSTRPRRRASATIGGTRPDGREQARPERRRAVAFARALIDGDGEGAGLDVGRDVGEGRATGRRRTFEEAPTLPAGWARARVGARERGRCGGEDDGRRRV